MIAKKFPEDKHYSKMLTTSIICFILCQKYKEMADKAIKHNPLRIFESILRWDNALRCIAIIHAQYLMTGSQSVCTGTHLYYPETTDYMAVVQHKKRYSDLPNRDSIRGYQIIPRQMKMPLQGSFSRVKDKAVGVPERPMVS